MKKRKHLFNNLQTILYENIKDLLESKKNKDKEIKKYANSLSEQDLNEKVECELIGGNKVLISRSIIKSHLVMHGGYHKGIIAEMMGFTLLPPIAQDITVRGKSKK